MKHAKIIGRIVSGGALVYFGAWAMEAGFDRLTSPSLGRVVKAAEDATKAAAPATSAPTAQEGTS